MKGEGGKKGTPNSKFYYYLLLVNICEWRFKFEQNRTINEQFYFFEGRGGGLNFDYYWYTYEIVGFQISEKSHHKWRLWLFRVGRGGGGGGGRGTPFMNFKLNYYWLTNENVLFQISAKSHHKWRTWLSEGGEGSEEGQGDLHLWILTCIIIGKHMKMFCFKFQQNRTIDK